MQAEGTFNFLVCFFSVACFFLHRCLDNAARYIVSASTSQWAALVTVEGTSNRMNQLCSNGRRIGPPRYNLFILIGKKTTQNSNVKPIFFGLMNHQE